MHTLADLQCVFYVFLLRELNAVCYFVISLIGLTIRAEMIGGDVPFYLKFWVKLTAL